MDELVTWLLGCYDREEQRLAEDERVARQAAALPHGSAEWFSGAEGSVLGVDPGSELHVRGAINSLDDIGVHIARHDPASVLAKVERGRRDVAGKRALLELHASGPSSYVNGRYVAGEPTGLVCDYCESLCHSHSGVGCEFPDAPWPCDTVSLLVQEFDGEPGWREEWRV